MLLFGSAKPFWRWLQRQRASGWPTVTGRIESVAVKPKRQFFISTTPRGRAPAFMAELAYSYALEGHHYSGYYQREFPTEEESWEFVRGLQGKSAMVSYNPRNPRKDLAVRRRGRGPPQRTASCSRRQIPGRGPRRAGVGEAPAVALHRART